MYQPDPSMSGPPQPASSNSLKIVAGVLAALLLIAAVTVVVTNVKQIRELNIFAVVLIVQSLPFLAAVAIAALEGSRFNEFAFWRGIEAKIAVALPGATTVVAETPVQLPADKQVETVQ